MVYTKRHFVDIITNIPIIYSIEHFNPNGFENLCWLLLEFSWDSGHYSRRLDFITSRGDRKKTNNLSYNQQENFQIHWDYYWPWNHQISSPLGNDVCLSTSFNLRAIFRHECLRRNIPPNSVNRRALVHYLQPWMMARHDLRRTVRKLVTDAHSRMNKYRNIIAGTRYLCEQVIDNETITKSATGIELRARNSQKRKRLPLARKLGSCTDDVTSTGDETFVTKTPSLVIRTPWKYFTWVFTGN